LKMFVPFEMTKLSEKIFHFEEDIKPVHRSLYLISSNRVKLKIFLPFEMAELSEKIFVKFRLKPNLMYILFTSLISYRRSLDYYTDKKENRIFLIYKEIQMGLGAKSFMRKGFLIYEEISKYFTIYEEAVLHPIPPNFLII
jgi:hypothetical protein